MSSYDILKTSTVILIHSYSVFLAVGTAHCDNDWPANIFHRLERRNLTTHRQNRRDSVVGLPFSLLSDCPTPHYPRICQLRPCVSAFRLPNSSGRRHHAYRLRIPRRPHSCAYKTSTLCPCRIQDFPIRGATLLTFTVTTNNYTFYPR